MNREDLKPRFQAVHPPCRAGGEGPPTLGPGGFTLLEVLLAFALLSVVLGAIYSTFFLSHKAMEGMDESLVRLQECRMVMERMGREVESLSYPEKNIGPVFKVEDRDSLGKQASRFSFQGFSPLRPGLLAISYYVEEREGKLILCKRMNSSYRTSPEEQGVELVEGLEGFLVEVRDGDRWLKTWDLSDTKKTPEEVKITLTVRLKERQISLLATARPQIGRKV